MDEAEQDQYEAHLKELFDSFDVTGTGSLGQEELTELCHVLHLEEVAPGALQQTLLRDGLPSRIHFDEFRDALILILSSTLTNDESFREADSSPEAQPKYIRGGKRYGRRTLPEFQTSVDDFGEVTVIKPLDEEAQPSRLPSDDGCDERWRSHDSEEYEAEGQLRFWNPDDLNAPPNISPTQDWIEEKLREVCESLGISRDGHLSRKKLLSICEQYGLQNIDTQVLEDIFCNLEHDGTMSIEDFFYGLFKIRKPLPPSASTPYRQLKRHHSMQAFDESGRRTTTPSAMTSTISFRVFSSLDDGMGYAPAERILDAWHDEGIKNSHEILKALEFSLDGKIDLAELTLALENELLIAKNGIYQAAMASFKTEIQYWMERADQEVREKEKLRLDLEKAERLTSLMASEVDDHHAAIERQNEYNLSKLDEEYKERITSLKSELQKDREQIQQQASKQRTELEHEVEKLKMEENFLRDRLALTLKENSRLERELLEMGEKLAKYESTLGKFQKNWETLLTEKFNGDLDPGNAEFFLEEERLMQMKNKYEQQCRELQDQIDELQSQLEGFRTQGKIARPLLKNSLFEELDDVGEEDGQELASEDCNPLNMSIEAEMVIEQMKDQHQRDLCDLQQELEDTVCHYEKQLEDTKACYEKEQEGLQQKHSEEKQSLELRVQSLQGQVSELQGELVRVQQEADSQWTLEMNKLQICLGEKASLLEHLHLQHERELQARLDEAEETFKHQREELIQSNAQLEEEMRILAQTLREEKGELEERFHRQLRRQLDEQTLEKEQLLQGQAEKYQRELQEQRTKMESEFNGRMSWKEEEFAAGRQALASKYGEAIKGLEERYQREMQQLSELQHELKSQWEFEKDEMAQDGAEAQERWKEMLEKERSVTSALVQEKNLLEKNFKEHINSLVVEKEALEEELQEVKKHARELCERLFEMQASHERELNRKEEEMSAMEEDQKLVCQKLGNVENEFAREREELNSRLVTLERLKVEMLSRAAEEKKELRLKVSGLEHRIQDLQHELQCLSRWQRNLVSLNKEKLEAQDRDSPGEGTSVLSIHGEFQEARGGGGGGGGDVTPFSVEGELLLKESKGEQTPSPSFLPLVPETFEDSQHLNMTDADHNQTRTEGRAEKPDTCGCLPSEREGITSDETMEMTLVLEKTYDEIWAENKALKVQLSLCLEQIRHLEAEYNQATHDRQDMASEVQKELEEILKTIPQPKMLPCGSNDEYNRTTKMAGCPAGNRRFFAEALEAELNIQELSADSLQLEVSNREATQLEGGELSEQMLDLWEVNDRKGACFRGQTEVLPLPEELKVENRVLKAEVIKLLERNTQLEGYLPKLISLQGQLEKRDQESLLLKEEKLELLERMKDLEGAHEQLVLDNDGLHVAKLALQSKLGTLEELVAQLKALKGGKPVSRSESIGKEAEAEKKGLKEKVTALLRQKRTHAQEKDHLNLALRDLQSTNDEQQQRLEFLRCETDRLREENAALRNEIALLNEEECISNLQLRELNGSQEDLWHKIGTIQKEKVAVEKLAENYKKQASELKARNLQLELENAERRQKNSPSPADVQDMNQQLVKSSMLVSSLEIELSQLRVQAQALEQENHFLKEELGKLKQLPRCLDFSDLQNEISTVILKNEKLLKEKESLGEELAQCVEQVAKTAFLENLVTSLKQEKVSLEHQNQSLKIQIAASQDKIQGFDDAVQNINLQMSRLRSDLRVSQQEKEALEQEVASVRKQLQAGDEKNRILEVAMHSPGLQSQQKKLCWDELEQLVTQEQQLLRQENEKLHQEAQNAKSELAHAREKVRELEATILTLKHQNHQNQSGFVKAIEQETLSLKRECERLQKELTAAHRKISQMNSFEHELETINLENEGLRKKQVKLDEQMLHSGSSTMLSLPQHPRELQQQGCPVVSWEQYRHLRHQFLQAERRCQHLQEELESRPLETNMPQSGHEQLFKTMERRMMDVEQQLRLVKQLLQDKVNQLKEQLTKNRKADEMVKDLYVENAQLLKALEVTEQRQKTVEKNNNLLEQKIANLGRIVENLTSPTLGSAAQLGS